jgi:hypothetical protein
VQVADALIALAELPGDPDVQQQVTAERNQVRWEPPEMHTPVGDR